MIDVGQDHRVFESVEREFSLLQRELKFEMRVLKFVQGLFGWVVLLERKVNRIGRGQAWLRDMWRRSATAG